MKVVICGGGTAGHIYPGLALAQELTRSRGAEILFVGPRRGVDSRILAPYDYPLTTIDSFGLERRLSLSALLAVVRLGKSVFQAIRVLRTFRPDVVTGFGGYGSFPVVLGAWFLGIPRVIHEQNALPGLANRLLARFANRICLSFPGTESGFPVAKTTVTGNPVRAILGGTNRQKGAEELGLDPTRRTLLVLGGSRGAASINMAVLEAYDRLRGLDWLQVIHITGTDHFDRVEADVGRMRQDNDKLLYRALPYLEEIDAAYAVADLVLSRAGATTIAELTAAGLPAVLVPYPYASEGHQLANARFLVDRGAALTLLNSDLNGESLTEEAISLLEGPDRLGEMAAAASACARPDAVEKLAGVVQEAAGVSPARRSGRNNGERPPGN